MLKLEKKMAKIAHSVWKVCKECVKVCEEAFESVWKYHHQIFQLKYIHLDTQHVEIKRKLTKIAQIVWKVREECESVCESVWKCVWKYYH